MDDDLVAAPSIYRKVGLRIGGGQGKTKLILPSHCDPEAFLHQLDEYTRRLRHIVPCFSACLDVPRHVVHDPEFIASSLQSLGVHHDRLLDLVESVAGEDPFAALRLFQVCCNH